MKQEKFLSPAALNMAEAAPAPANGTCGKYQKISKENTRFSWISTWGLLKEKLKMHGSERFNCSQSQASRKSRNPGFSLHIMVLLK
jgi:hypothetical protein